MQCYNNSYYDKHTTFFHVNHAFESDDFSANT